LLRDPLEEPARLFEGAGQQCRDRLVVESKADVVGLFLLTVGCTLRVSCEYWRTRVMYGSFRLDSAGVVPTVSIGGDRAGDVS
jgi:hypothetical protein